LAKNIIKLFCIKSRQGSKVGWGAKTLYLTKGSDKDKTKNKSEVFLVL
jgi:hypothetical protein